MAGILRRSRPFTEALSLAQEAVPAGLLSIEPLAGFMRERIISRAHRDAFDALPRRLFIPAIDLDTGERVVFGACPTPEESQSVPQGDVATVRAEPTPARVSQAVAASCAIPRYFRPVTVDDRDLIDGGIADAPNLDIALDAGATEILAINPLVAPINDRDRRCLPSRNARCGRVAEQGLVAALAQALNIGHMMMTEMGLRLHRLTSPEVPVEIVQPDRFDADLSNPMDFHDRERLIEQGWADGVRFLRRPSPVSAAVA